MLLMAVENVRDARVHDAIIGYELIVHFLGMNFKCVSVIRKKCCLKLDHLFFIGSLQQWNVARF